MTTGTPVRDFFPQPDEACFCGGGKSFGLCCGSKEKRRPAPHGVKRIPGFIPPAKCRKWVRYLEQQPRARAQVFDEVQSKPGHPVYVEDPARVCHDVHPGNLLKAINQTTARAFRVVSQSLSREVEWFERPRVLRYGPGGHYAHHADAVIWVEELETYMKVEDRNLSLLLYINDDYEGGGLTFTRLNCFFRPRVGDMLMFPSGLAYEHRANKVTSGIRYAIASWAAFTNEPRIRAEPPPGVIYMKDP